MKTNTTKWLLCVVHQPVESDELSSFGIHARAYTGILSSFQQ